MLFFISLLHFVYAYCVRFFRVEHLTVCVTCMDDLRLYVNSVVRRQCAVIRVRNGQRRKTKRKKNRRTIVWAYTLPFANIWPKMLHKMRATEIERGENRMFCLFAEKKIIFIIAHFFWTTEPFQQPSDSAGVFFDFYTWSWFLVWWSPSKFFPPKKKN